MIEIAIYLTLTVATIIMSPQAPARSPLKIVSTPIYFDAPIRSVQAIRR